MTTEITSAEFANEMRGATGAMIDVDVFEVIDGAVSIRHSGFSGPGIIYERWSNDNVSEFIDAARGK